MIVRGIIIALFVALGVSALALVLTGCQVHVPPRATAFNPICLAFCSSRADIGDDSVNTVQHTYSPNKAKPPKAPPKPASAPPPASAASAASAPLPASTVPVPDLYKH